MNRKTLILCGIMLASALPAWAAPMTYKEIAMMLRNGETAHSIISDTAKRKLLQLLTPQQEKELAALGATPDFLEALRNPENLVPGPAADAYKAQLQKQKAAAQQEQQKLEQEAQRKAQEQAKTLQQAKAQAAIGDPQSPQPNGSQQGQTPSGQQTGPVQGKVLDLKFTAADGSTVDFSKLRGKVVLLDFWATWCGPCMHEVPNVVAAYKKYHEKGFEIVGISLDKDRNAMLKVTREREMTWPQYFDGLGWQNKISGAFGIRAIPAMWLVNKWGVIANTNARESLDQSIAKLLAE